MSYENITTDRQLRSFCDSLAGAKRICFDTEFVSEHTFRPQLCLVQVAAAERLAVIDPLSISDMRPFWEVLAQDDHETIVHAGREELLFSIQSIGRRPANLFDVQIAAGLVGFEYPAGYGSLLMKLLGERSQKGETRTDWRVRPLSDRQIDYALDDVRYLEAMRDKLQGRLERLGRTSWMAAEMADWQGDVEATRSTQRWWKISGISGLSARSLAVIRELWLWREEEAGRRDSPAKRILRDDLMVEVAKRRSADPKQIRAVRGFERGDLQRAIPKLCEAVERGLAVPEDQLPTHTQREMPPQLNVLGQFLSSALSSICRRAQVAASIVGAASDVRELIAYQLNLSGSRVGDPPILAQGWRAEVVGRLIEDLLEGRVSVRVQNPLDDEPLTFDPYVPAETTPQSN